MQPIYLDNNATTRMHPAVIEAMRACDAQGYANPASPHQMGQVARRRLERDRQWILECLGGRNQGADVDRLIFTSGGTESNNLGLRGLVAPGTPLAVSAIEHPSVLEPARRLESQGHPLHYLPVNEAGRVQVDHLPEVPIGLASVMLANHETGVLQPVAEIAEACHARGIAVHCDAVQAVGKISVSFASLGVDAMSFTAHKFHGPPGIGGLIVRGRRGVNPVLFGGSQQQGARPGTESLTLVAGMRKALEICQSAQQARAAHLRRLRDQLEHRLLARIEGLRVCGFGSRLPHTANLAFCGLDRQALLLALDMQGIACATGSACQSGSSEPSHVLLAMGCDQAAVDGALRFSVGCDNTAEEIAEACLRIERVVEQLHAGA